MPTTLPNRTKVRETAAKIYAVVHGYEGRNGGWIYNAEGRPIVQGWRPFADRLERTRHIYQNTDGFWLVDWSRS